MAAVVFITSKPVDAFLRGQWEPGFKFLPVTYDSKFEDYYLPAALEAADYPAADQGGRAHLDHRGADRAGLLQLAGRLQPLPARRPLHRLPLQPDRQAAGRGLRPQVEDDQPRRDGARPHSLPGGAGMAANARGASRRTSNEDRGDLRCGDACASRVGASAAKRSARWRRLRRAMRWRSSAPARCWRTCRTACDCLDKLSRDIAAPAAPPAAAPSTPTPAARGASGRQLDRQRDDHRPSTIRLSPSPPRRPAAGPDGVHAALDPVPRRPHGDGDRRPGPHAPRRGLMSSPTAINDGQPVVVAAARRHRAPASPSRAMSCACWRRCPTEGDIAFRVAARQGGTLEGRYALGRPESAAGPAGRPLQMAGRRVAQLMIPEQRSTTGEHDDEVRTGDAVWRRCAWRWRCFLAARRRWRRAGAGGDADRARRPRRRIASSCRSTATSRRR